MLDFTNWTITAWVLIVVALLVAPAIVIARRYVKVGPNEVLIISGIKHRVRDQDGNKLTVGYRVVKGGGTFVFPVLERVDRVSLELFSLDVNTPEVYTRRGVPVIVDGIAQVKVKSDDYSIRIAAEQFLSKGRTDIMRIALQTLEGHLRAIIGSMTVEDAYNNREQFASRVQEVAESDMEGMGLTIISFTIRDIKDKQGYLDALGRPQIAEVKKNAEVSEANAKRDTLIRSAQADQEGQSAKIVAETEIARAERDKDLQLAEFAAVVKQKQAIADLAYDLEKNKLSQQLRAEELQIELVEKSKRIEIEEKEIERRERELDSSVRKPAEAERYKIEMLADAEKLRIERIAHGEAEATRQRGEAEAAAEQARGLASAEITRQQGYAEAESMDKKAAAWQNYNEAALAQLFADKLPDIARAVADPLSKTERMVVISSDGGASKVTKDIGQIIADLPPVIESLTGLQLKELLKKVPQLGKLTPEKERTDPESVVDRGKITIAKKTEKQSEE